MFGVFHRRQFPTLVSLAKCLLQIHPAVHPISISLLLRYRGMQLCLLPIKTPSPVRQF